MVYQALPGRLKSCVRQRRLHSVSDLTSSTTPARALTHCRIRPDRKVWDTFSGDPLHSFPHNHIVRTVAISRTSSHILTGGQEKKVRIFDLARPDAEADLLGDPGTTSHEKTVKSVVWVGEHTGVSAAEDGMIKCGYPPTILSHLMFTYPQMVGSAHSETYDLACVPQSHHVYGAVCAD